MLQYVLIVSPEQHHLIFISRFIQAVLISSLLLNSTATYCNISQDKQRKLAEMNCEYLRSFIFLHFFFLVTTDESSTFFVHGL